MSIESHLDQVFAEGAAQVAKDMAGRVYNYRLECLGSMVKDEDHGKTGQCRVLGVHYSKGVDCNVYHLLDLATNQEFSVDQFEVNLKEVTE